MAGSVASKIAPHLPLLRRHARALTGTQDSGDAYVRACLEALVGGDEVLDEDHPPRIALYKLFHGLWSTTQAKPRANAGDGFVDGAVQSLDMRLSQITPRSRQALLLTSMEGFSAEEAGAILGVSAEEIEELKAKAYSEIDAQTRTRVLIIEDEPLIAMDLRELVESLGHSVTGIARTHAEALEICEASTPGLILSDIQLADGSYGTEATSEIRRKFDSPPVIFITAFPEQLLTGEREEPAFLITKPFNNGTVRAAIAQSLFFSVRPDEHAS